MFQPPLSRVCKKPAPRWSLGGTCRSSIDEVQGTPPEFHQGSAGLGGDPTVAVVSWSHEADDSAQRKAGGKSGDYMV